MITWVSVSFYHLTFYYVANYLSFINIVKNLHCLHGKDVLKIDTS